MQMATYFFYLFKMTLSCHDFEETEIQMLLVFHHNVSLG